MSESGSFNITARFDRAQQGYSTVKSLLNYDSAINFAELVEKELTKQIPNGAIYNEWIEDNSTAEQYFCGLYKNGDNSFHILIRLSEGNNNHPVQKKSKVRKCYFEKNGVVTLFSKTLN